MDTNNEHQNAAELFISQLQILWGTEQAILKSLPDMISKSNDEGLRNVLRLHFAETLNQTSSLRGIFKQLDIDAEGDASTSFIDLLQEGRKTLGSDGPSYETDLKIISMSRSVERYEIELYMDSVIEAGKLDLTGAEKTLLSILNEEKLALVKLDFLSRNIEELISQRHAESVY